MTGKKKGKKGRKTQVGENEPTASAAAMCENLQPDAAAAETGTKRLQHSATNSPSSNNASTEVDAEHSSVLIGGSRLAFGSGDSEPSSLPVLTKRKDEAKPKFVFSAGQNSTCQGVDPPLSSAESTADSTTSTLLTGLRSTRSNRPSIRRRGTKCPPSERFGNLGSKLRQQTNLQLAAQEVAFGQGRDPLSLVVSYEESGLRRIVKAPDGCSSDTIVDNMLRQAVAGTALDSGGWQEALNHPKEDLYFTYSTVPEGLTIAKFRDIKGKILVTPLSADSGLLKLKEEAEKKRKAAEETLENVREYLQRLKSEDENECSREKGSNCPHCRSIRIQLDDLLGLLKHPPSV